WLIVVEQLPEFTDQPTHPCSQGFLRLIARHFRCCESAGTADHGGAGILERIENLKGAGACDVEGLVLLAWIRLKISSKRFQENLPLGHDTWCFQRVVAESNRYPR